MRTIGGFLIVYGLGALGIQTLIPYIAVVLAATVDGIRTVRLARRESTD